MCMCMCRGGGGEEDPMCVCVFSLVDGPLFHVHYQKILQLIGIHVTVPVRSNSVEVTWLN